jgi:hypothetical protein
LPRGERRQQLCVRSRRPTARIHSLPDTSQTTRRTQTSGTAGAAVRRRTRSETRPHRQGGQREGSRHEGSVQRWRRRRKTRHHTLNSLDTRRTDCLSLRGHVRRVPITTHGGRGCRAHRTVGPVTTGTEDEDFSEHVATPLAQTCGSSAARFMAVDTRKVENLQEATEARICSSSSGVAQRAEAPARTRASRGSLAVVHKLGEGSGGPKAASRQGARGPPAGSGEDRRGQNDARQGQRATEKSSGFGWTGGGARCWRAPERTEMHAAAAGGSV